MARGCRSLHIDGVRGSSPHSCPRRVRGLLPAANPPPARAAWINHPAARRRGGIARTARRSWPDLAQSGASDPAVSAARGAVLNADRGHARDDGRGVRGRCGRRTGECRRRRGAQLCGGAELGAGTARGAAAQHEADTRDPCAADGRGPWPEPHPGGSSGRARTRSALGTRRSRRPISSRRRPRSWRR